MRKKKKQKLVYLQILLYFCDRFMTTELKNSLFSMLRRWAYMLLAIGASALLFAAPPFHFEEDKGIIYVRSFSMDQTTFTVTQTEISTNMQQVVSTMSVKSLYYCSWVLLATSIACFLCFFKKNWRIAICYLAMVFAGAYYILLVYYALRIEEDFYATFSPTWIVILPAIVLQLMLLIRRETVRSIRAEDTNEETEE